MKISPLKNCVIYCEGFKAKKTFSPLLDNKDIFCNPSSKDRQEEIIDRAYGWANRNGEKIKIQKFSKSLSFKIKLASTKRKEVKRMPAKKMIEKPMAKMAKSSKAEKAMPMQKGKAKSKCK